MCGSPPASLLRTKCRTRRGATSGSAGEWSTRSTRSTRRTRADRRSRARGAERRGAGGVLRGLRDHRAPGPFAGAAHGALRRQQPGPPAVGHAAVLPAARLRDGLERLDRPGAARGFAAASRGSRGAGRGLRAGHRDRAGGDDQRRRDGSAGGIGSAPARLRAGRRRAAASDADPAVARAGRTRAHPPRPVGVPPDQGSARGRERAHRGRRPARWRLRAGRDLRADLRSVRLRRAGRRVRGDPRLRVLPAPRRFVDESIA